jgi:hypothetical protein
MFENVCSFVHMHLKFIKSPILTQQKSKKMYMGLKNTEPSAGFKLVKEIFWKCYYKFKGKCFKKM